MPAAVDGCKGETGVTSEVIRTRKRLGMGELDGDPVRLAHAFDGFERHYRQVLGVLGARYIEKIRLPPGQPLRIVSVRSKFLDQGGCIARVKHLGHGSFLFVTQVPNHGTSDSLGPNRAVGPRT